MKPLRKVLTLASAAVIAAGCSDAASSGDPLSQADTEELAAAIIEQGTADFSGAFHRTNPDLPPGLSLAPQVEITRTISQTNSCEGSGTVALAGKFTASSDDGTTGTIAFDYTVTPANCRFTTESAKQYTVSGDPNLKVSGGFDFTQTSIEGALNYDGKFKWESADGMAGACKFDISAEYDFSTGDTSFNGTVVVTGSVCGHTINRTETIQVSG